MNLYYAASLYHILCFSIHALIYEKNTPAHLVVSDNIFSKSGMEELEKRLNQSNIFYRVTIMSFTNGEFYNEYPLEEGCSHETIKKHLNFAAEQIEQWLIAQKIDLNQYEKKYTAIDHRLLGMYFLYKGYPYTYFEDGSGLLSRSESQLKLHRSLQYETYCIVKELGGFGANPYVQEKFANAKAQLPGFYDPLMKDFNCIDLFSILTPKQQEQIFTIYGLSSKLKIHQEHTFLFLTRFAKYLKNPDVFHHMYLNSALLDLFAKDHQVIIKPHPRDYSGTYALSYPNAIVLERTFPSELLPFLQDKKYNRIMTIGSSAIDSLNEFGNQIFKFGEELEEKSSFLFTYYTAVRLLLDFFPNILPEELGLYGCSMELMIPLFETYGGFTPKSSVQLSCTAAIVDIQSDGFKPQADFIIYLHTDGKFQFYKEDPSCFSRMFYLDLSLTPKTDSWFQRKKEHYILIETSFCHQNEKTNYQNYISSKLETWHYEEDLPHLKAHLTAGKISSLQRTCLLAKLYQKALRTLGNPLCKNSPVFLHPEKEFYNKNTLICLQQQIDQSNTLNRKEL